MMKWTQQNPLTLSTERCMFKLNLLDGLIGMNDLKNFHGVIEKDMPFIELQSQDEMHLGFWAMDPFPYVENYILEVAQEDLDQLNIQEEQDALFLTLATMNSHTIALNLVAPILINRKTQIGKQIVLENYKKYSVRHIIYEGAAQCLC